MISVDGGSHYRYPSMDAQSAEITITKVQLGYMCMPDSEAASMRSSPESVWDFYGTWTSKSQSMSTEMGRMDWSWET